MLPKTSLRVTCIEFAIRAANGRVQEPDKILDIAKTFETWASEGMNSDERGDYPFINQAEKPEGDAKAFEVKADKPGVVITGAADKPKVDEAQADQKSAQADQTPTAYPPQPGATTSTVP